MNYFKTENGMGTIIEEKRGWLTVDFDGEVQKLRKSAGEILTDADIEEMMEEELPHTMSNQLKKYRPTYTTHDDAITASGRKVVDNNDQIANSLRGLWIDDLYPAVAKILDVPVAELKAKYSHLNNGQQSMNLRNRVRGHFRRMESAK